ncbi:MAG: hypothetical protein BGO90_01235 [Legionella sp. 40-6]|nr:hypothetical protein [Legionella sp.]OJY38415.1 MAG: hypothetical protein BGO90_01235 [Legionella sp. 40-6]
MPFSPEQLMALENPYKDLNADQLAENEDVLNNLSAADKHTLAVKMVTLCPVNELKEFTIRLRAIKSLIPNSESFHQAIEPLVRIKSVLTNLDKPELNNPQEYLQENAAIMRKYPGFTKDMVAMYQQALPKHMDVMAVISKTNKPNMHGMYGHKSTPTSLPDTTAPHSPLFK